MNEIIRARDIEIVTAEIVTIKRQAQQVLIHSAIEIGRRLTEAKAMVPFGEWGKYLEERVEYSQSTANNLMKIYKEYGSDQESLFDGFAKSQSFANLNYTQALALLSVPADDREQFAVENDVEHKSTREIQELIRQRDEALEAQAGAEAALAEAKDMVDIAADKMAEKDNRLKSAEESVAAREKEAAELRALLDKAKKAEKEAKAQLKEARENPTISDDQMAQIRQEAEATAGAEAAQKAAKRFEAKLAKAEKELVAAKQAAEDAKREAQEERETAEAALKQLKLASPEAAVFKTLFAQTQSSFNSLFGAYYDIQKADPGLAANLKTAILTMLEQQRKAVAEE